MMKVIFCGGFATGVLVTVCANYMYSKYIRTSNDNIPKYDNVYTIGQYGTRDCVLPKCPRIKYYLSDIIAHIKYVKANYPDIMLILDFCPHTNFTLDSTYTSSSAKSSLTINHLLELSNIDQILNKTHCIVELTPLEMEYIHLTSIQHYIEDDVFLDSVE